jgi:hypothetical protein
MRCAMAWISLFLVASACSPSQSTDGADGGCSGGEPQTCPPDAPGFKATIAPIVNVSCVSCHEPGGTSTIYLRNYQEISAASVSVLHEVAACRMPPPDFPPLTSGAREDLLTWFKCGALEN